MTDSATVSPAWYPDELAHAGPEHLDQDYVAQYDRKAGTDASEELHNLQRLGLSTSSTLIDLGAGTGTMALAAAPYCRRVVAVDVSPAMLGALQQRALELGLTNVECVRAGFLTYQHTGPKADFVYSRHALHQLPDFWKAVALRRIAAVLRPGGIFRVRDLFLSCALNEVDTVVEAWLANAPTDSQQGWPRAELETHLREEHSTFTWLFEPMLAQAGFTISEATYTPSRTHTSYTCVLASESNSTF
jgi:ubiquinone/menaquinone biosynthesis C-methylase UbiE